MTMPNFLVVGAAKSGTTSLANYLRQHPQIFIPEFKEPHYFCNATWGGVPFINDLESYEALFDDVSDEVAIGECSTGYLYYPEAPKLIYERIPECKIIIILRNPVDRAFSLYGHMVRDGVEKLNFEDAIAEERVSLRYINGHDYGYNYIKIGFVSELVRAYIQLFGRNRVFIRTFDAYTANTDSTLKDLFNFLGVNPECKVNTKKKLNASGLPQFKYLHDVLNDDDHWLRRIIRRPIRMFLNSRQRKLWWQKLRSWNIAISGKQLECNPETRAMLLSEFDGEIKDIEIILGGKIPDWRE